ncbi:MAG TPA: hypothetical protein VMZ53_26710 [Kofleriaceae bacterium]|nr:hypothetical protein [Kofleriaceae bacterium]
MTARGLAIAAVVALAPTIAHASPELDALVKDVPTCAARTYCFAIRVHVPLDDRGAPIATAAWIAGQVAAANQHFEKLDVAFQIDGIGPLPAAAARVEDRKERDSFGGRLSRKVIDWFVTGQLDDIDIPGAQVFGVTWRRGDRKFVIVSTQARERTLAHELGHFFGLPHSTYAISIMNKTPREEPPPEARTFADEEYARMKPRVKDAVRSRIVANVKRRR